MKIEEPHPQSNERYRAIVEQQAELVCRWLPDGTLTFVNGAYCRFFGKSQQELHGSSFYLLIQEDQREDLQESISGILAELKPENSGITYVNQLHDAKGASHWIEWTEQAIFSADGQLIEIQSVGRDITASKESEFELIRERRFYSNLAEGVGGIIWVIDFTTLSITYVSPQSYTLLGIPPEEWLGPIDIWLSAIHPEDRNKTYDYCLAEVLACRDFSCEYRILTPSRGTVWLRAIATVETNDGVPTIVRGLAIDISKERQKQRTLQESNRQLRRFSLHLDNVREDERQQIARRIHDDLGQTLTALNFELTWLKKRQQSRELIERIEGMTDLVRQATHTVRNICTELRPTLLDDLGLAAAIEWQLKEFRRRIGIQTVSRISPLEHCSFQLAANYYRIFMEALTNIIRHAEASLVTVTLAEIEGVCILDVSDNGKGIPAGAMRRRNAFGLNGIRERAELLGGSAKIRRNKSGGTRITVTSPCQNNEKSQTGDPK